jgi:hypothetical protein
VCVQIVESFKNALITTRERLFVFISAVLYVATDKVIVCYYVGNTEKLTFVIVMNYWIWLHTIGHTLVTFVRMCRECVEQQNSCSLWEILSCFYKM